MGGKGRKRREKNYRESHGGRNTRLPPPPDPSSLDTLPSKLRKLMGFTGAKKKSMINSAEAGDGGVSKMLHLKEKSNTKITGIKRKFDGDEPAESNVHEKKNKKRKKNKVNDMRFESTEELGGAGSGSGSRRKERRKQRLEERKKKRKKTTKTEEDADFPRHELIKFGEVVDAPPKLLSLPKGLKNTQEASQERLRLKAIEAYRNRKGWASRPGVQLPPSMTTLPSL